MALKLNLAQTKNPVIDRRPHESVRDPALLYENNLFYCFHTTAVPTGDRYQLYLDLSTSPDLSTWTEPQRLTTSELNFSSPGNIIRVSDQWVLCVQSYPIEAGQKYGSEASRLWLMRSPDLKTWTGPKMISPQGCQAAWTKSRRQIDPYLVYHAKRYWCFYKTSGQLGLLVSDDLETWAEASPDRPVLGQADTPDGVTVENPCVFRQGPDFVMAFAPCRPGRGVGLAYSDDLIHWRDVHYLDFPALPWANNGPTAAMITPMPDTPDQWLMLFHGESTDPQNVHSAAIGLAWSDDLETWQVP